MLLDLQPSKSSELVPFQSCCVAALDSCEFTNTHCGLSSDGSLTWIYKGAALEVVSTSTGHRVASLDAQHLLRDEEAVVTCASEFPCQSRPRLVVAMRGSAEQGMVVLLDVASSLIVKAVEIPQQVTALEKVLTYGGSSVPSWALSEQLRQFYGIVAVGTEGGYVYLVDLALDWTYSVDSSQKIMPCPLRLLELRERDVQGVRQLAFQAGQHLALRLGVDEQSHSNDCFHFRGPDLTVRQSFNEDEVHVSCLKYIPQSGTLAIGYSFGGFHLWKLFNPVIEYASTVEVEDLPVAFFVYQEPENDPKNFAYLWVCRDDRLSEQKQESLCSLSLYQLSYSRRTFYANYGNFFEELNLLTLRLEHHLTVEPYNNRNNTTWSSQLLSAFIITDPSYHPSARLIVNDSFEEGCQGPDLSLCAFAWEAQDSRPGSRSEVFLAVFDMNRWYHAQMPARIKCVNVEGQELCPFLAVYSMNDAVYKEGNDNLVDIQVKPGSLLRFVNNSPMPPEQHYYPSSLAFDTVCVLSSGIVTASILGVQRQVLASLESNGPSCLLKPFDLYHRCLQTGLMARSADTSVALSTEEQQRMSLLTLALDQGQIHFITSCISSWADGDYIQQGCTLQFILTWAWARITAIKQQIDLTCRPLFDWSEAPVDQRMLQVLQNSLCCLGHLRTILHTLMTQSSSPVSQQGQVELEHRMRVVTLLHYHLKVMLWFVHNGLLPEHEDTGKSSPMHYVYPASELAQVFADRRRQMIQNPCTVNTHEMILIDAMVHSAGGTLSELWKNEEGTGVYPPPNLHAALSVYLLDGVEEKTKNAIILYLLFDMAAVAHGQQEEFAEKIPRFARAFDLPLGLVQQIHGFWLIDHMNFQEGLNQLRLRSGEDLGPWQHSCILRALMHQGERAAALRYLSLRNPPMLTAEDLKMRLNILMANRLVNQAMTFVRNSCGPGDQEPMLKHIFSLCQQQKLMNVLLKLPLTEKEEKCLQNFLSDNTDSAAAELLVLHLLQRSQYVPAIRLNDRMKHRATMDMSNKARERFKTRNSIVEGFRQSLPATQQYLINNPPAPFRMPTTLKIEVPRPKPLSTIVTQRVERRANSKSTMILAVMDKVAEAGKLIAEEEGLDDKDEEEDMVVPQSQSLLLPKKELADREAVAVNKPGPFLCTPTTTPRHYARRSHTGQVVFPTVKGMTQALLSSAALTSPLSPAANRRSQVFTADCMSLLQTPKIDHTPAKVASLVRSTTTPHSILKVSRLPRSSPRTKGVSRSPRGQPKRLGFSTSASQHTPLPSTPTSLTPSSTPSPTSAAEPMSFKAATVDQSKTEKSLLELVTPKQIRFSEPEIREISPPYVSPDSLARPPLRSSPDEDRTSPENQNSLQQETSPGETMVQSDEEITFNISHQVAEPMDAESDSSTLPVTTPSPATDRAPFATPVPPSSSPEPLSLQSEDQEYVQFQAHQSEQNTTTTDSGPKGQLSGSSLYDRAAEKETSLRDRSPLSVRTSKESDEVSRSQRWRLSPHRSPTSFSRDKVDQKEVVTQTSVFTETKCTSFISRERTYQREIKIESEESVAAVKEAGLLRKTEPQEALPVLECEKESDAQPDQSAESMETIEPDEDNILIEARQASSASSKNVVEELEHETVEVAADDLLELEVQVPTPIRHSSRRSTPERSVRSTRTTRRTGLKIDLTAVDKEKERTEPTPPKLRRISPSREKPPEDTEWPEIMPSLQLEFSDDDDNNSNENHLRPTPKSSPGRNQMTSHSPPVSPSQKGLKGAQGLSQSTGRDSVDHSPPFSLRSRRSSDRSPPISPSQRAAGSGEKSPVSPKLLVNVNRSPPVSPLRRSTRSVDRSPPVSPSRRSTRSVDHSPPISPSRRSRSVDRSPPVSPSRRSTKSVDHSLPVSPSRRSTRSVDRSPPVSPSRKSARSVDRSPPVSPSRRSTRSVDRSPPVSPSRKSMKDADHSIPAHWSKRSARSGHHSPPHSPSRRSTRSADRSPPPSPSRTSRQRDTEQVKSAETDLPVVKSRTTEELTVKTESAGEELMPPPVSPLRRSTRLRTPERSPGRKERTPERTTKTRSAESREEISEMPDSTSPVDIGESLADLAAKSPTRRSQRAKTPDIVNQADSKPEVSSESEQPVHVEESRSPSRRNARQTKETFTPRTPSRRSTRPSKTPDLSTTEPALSSKEAGQKSKASEKSLSAASKSEKHEGANQETTLKQETSPAASEKAVLEKASSSSRRSTRSRSKTPEPLSGHVATRLREKGKVDKSESIMEEIKDITAATEEVRTMRKQQRDTSSRTTTKMSPVAQETGDAPSFQFAAPTPLSRVQTDSLPAPPTDVSTFIFSPPITRSTRSQRGSTSSTSTTKSTRSRAKKEVSVNEESMDVVPEIDESASKDKSETSTRRKISAKSRKKTKETRSIPSASPSDSPISLLSPGEPDASEAQPHSSEQGTSRKAKKPAGATSSRVLRKRKVKLW